MCLPTLGPVVSEWRTLCHIYCKTCFRAETATVLSPFKITTSRGFTSPLLMFTALPVTLRSPLLRAGHDRDTEGENFCVVNNTMSQGEKSGYRKV